MSRFSLSTVLETLEDEFEEAEKSYYPNCMDGEEKSSFEESEELTVPTMGRHSDPAADSEGLGPPLLESTILNTSEDLCESLVTMESDFEGPTNVEIEFESSAEDAKEKQALDDFFQATCDCKCGPQKKACSTQFSRDVVERYRANCHQLTSAQLDLVVMAQLSASRTHKDCIPSTYKGNPSTFCPHTSFSFHGIKVCQDMFLFLHVMSHRRLETLSRHVDAFGIVERLHGNTKRLPANAHAPAVIEQLVAFIDNIAESHAQPLPGRLPNFKDSKVLLLPTDLTKAKVYRDYETLCGNAHETPVGRTKFYDVWRETRPFVVTLKPAYDLCFDCQKLATALSNSGHLSDDEKATRLTNYTDHLSLAKKARAEYNQQITTCHEAYNSPTVGEDVPMHYSYDFAQQVHFPNNPLQPGPAYFLTARKCQIFGVACEPLGWQVNYLIDEADVVGKGANTTISLLHHFFEERAEKGKEVYLHADNCVGQNKNNATMQYLAWRVLTGKHNSITLTFMLSGHTKFAPDRHFGLIKKSYRRTRVETMGCLQRVVETSSHIGANRAQLIRSLEGQQLVHFYDWSAFFHQYFSAIPRITSYHSFQFSCTNPGKVIIHESAAEPSEITIDILRQPIPQGELPPLIIPKGLDIQRQWYLYNNIRQFCTSNLSKDLTCPKPTSPISDRSVFSPSNSSSISCKRRASTSTSKQSIAKK